MRREIYRRGAKVALAVIALGTTTVVFGYQNGRLPQSALSPIYHPQYTLYLENDAAAAWNTMRQYTLARGFDLYPNGQISAYRTYDEQVQAKRDYGSNAATPGTSNHGLGLAVDVATPAMRHTIDTYGAQFGWAKKWSDASWEWWHIKYRAGVWSGNDPGPDGSGAPSTPSTPSTPDPSTSTPPDNSSTGNVILEEGDNGPRVESLQRALNANGASLTVDGAFGPATDAAVRAFQRANGLTADGIAGPDTLRALNLSTF